MKNSFAKLLHAPLPGALFTYGTLRRGEPNHPLLVRARFLGEAATPPRYALVDLGPFPAMIAGGQTAVVGEVYAVDETTLARLDILEGHPSFYQRQRIQLATGQEVEAYLMAPGRVAGRPRIPSGDWRTR
jgi:gamma-glutamylaminecyclotransferase